MRCYRMLLELSDITPLKNFFDVIYDTSLNSVEIRLDQDKLSIILLNNSHVAFYNLEISKDFFIEYEIDGVESILVFMDDFYKILKSSSKDDMLTLESNSSNLICTFEKDNSRRVFELPLAEDYGELPTPPSIDYDAEFNVLLDDLKQPCTDLDKVVKTDRFKMILSDSVLNIVAPKDTMVNYNQMINVDSESQGNVIVNNSYVQDLLKLSKINKSVTLKMGDGLPLSWNIESYDHLVKVSGLIAPIIEED